MSVDGRKMKTPLSLKLAEAVYSVLVEDCGARENERVQFIGYMTTRDNDPEWREWCFRGLLGWGGKCKVNHGRLYVCCYHEDETSDRRDLIERTNQRLQELVA